MSLSDDDAGVTRRKLDDRTAEALLAGRPVADEPALSALMTQMRGLTPAQAPAPNAALADLLSHGFEPQVSAIAARAARPGRAVSWAFPRRAVSWSLPLQLGLGAAVIAVALAGGAASNSLPPIVQTAVADVVEAVTPLTVPRPLPAPPTEPADDPVPAPTATAPGADRDDSGQSESPDRRDSDDGTGTGSDGDKDGRESSSDREDAESGDDRPSARPTVVEGDDDRSGSSGSGRDTSRDSSDSDSDAQPEPSPRPEATPDPDETDRSGSSSRTSNSELLNSDTLVGD